MTATPSAPLAAVLLAPLLAIASPAQDRAAQLQDLDALCAAIAKHPGFRERVPAEAWQQATARARERLASATPAGAFLELSRLVAMLGDGHTALQPTEKFEPAARSHPIQFAFLGDELVVAAAAPQHADLVGRQVITVGTATAMEALRRLRPFVSADNDEGAKRWVALWLAFPELLRAAGLLAKGGMQLGMARADGGTESVLLPDPEPGPPAVFGPRPHDWKIARAPGAAEPLRERQPERAWFHEYLPDAKVYYLRLREIADRPEATMAGMCAQLFAELARSGADKLVIDLRGNRGGNNYLTQPLIHGVLKSAVDRPGHLFVLTDAGTFSAAVNCAARIERETHALFAGEGTGAGPNHFGDAEEVPLPSGTLLLHCSTVRWQESDPRDQRRAILPDLPAPLQLSDLRAGRDPALEAVLTYDPARAPAAISPNRQWRRASQQSQPVRSGSDR